MEAVGMVPILFGYIVRRLIVGFGRFGYGALTPLFRVLTLVILFLILVLLLLPAKGLHRRRVHKHGWLRIVPKTV